MTGRYFGIVVNSWSGDCYGEARVEGKVRFAEDDVGAKLQFSPGTWEQTVGGRGCGGEESWSETVTLDTFELDVGEFCSR
jgi:hypothetical protein